MSDIHKNSVQMLLYIVRLSRREICKFGAILGLGFWPFLTLNVKRIFAEKEDPGIRPLLERRDKAMKLMPAVLDGTMSLEKAIKQRRTVRSFSENMITMQQFSQILWSAQGITEDKGFKRAAPSGGALYPSDIYAVVGKSCVEGLDEGVYHYRPEDHSITRTGEGDRRKQVATASLRQTWMSKAPVSVVVTAEYDRICVKYGQRGIRYALVEVGHIGQNIFLQCQALGLEAGIVGAFNDNEVAEAVGCPKNYEPLLIMPVGWEG
jgi:SagB-type dehydrogenase family enzyme